jgi:hypothetical protein
VADTVVGFTPGTGADIKAYNDGSSDLVQYVRPHTASTSTLDAWTVSTTAATSRVASDEARVALVFTNASTTDVYARPDSTAPTSAAYFVKIPSGGLYEVPPEWRELAWSVLGASASTGALNIWKGTA